MMGNSQPEEWEVAGERRRWGGVDCKALIEIVHLMIA
jgi:hypothetical protein